MIANLNLEEFMKELQQHFVSHPPLPASMPVNTERLNTLIDNGIVFLPNYVPRERIDELVSKIAWLPASLRDGRLEELPKEHKDAFPDWGLYRVYDIDRMYGEANLLKNDPVIQDIVQSYLSNTARHARSCIELRDIPGDLEALPEHLMPHFDSYFREVKVWLLLIDVGMSQGPMRYYTKTHKYARWRAVPDYLRYLGGIWPDTAGVHPNAIPWLHKHSAEWAGVERIYCTGQAGMVIIADTRGLHHAWPLEPGNIRLDMYSDYRMDGHEYR